jgi:hypothetical protein
MESLPERSLADREGAAKTGDVKRFVKIGRCQGFGLVDEITVRSARRCTGNSCKRYWLFVARHEKPQRSG